MKAEIIIKFHSPEPDEEGYHAPTPSDEHIEVEVRSHTELMNLAYEYLNPLIRPGSALVNFNFLEPIK